MGGASRANRIVLLQRHGRETVARRQGEVLSLERKKRSSIELGVSQAQRVSAPPPPPAWDLLKEGEIWGDEDGEEMFGM